METVIRDVIHGDIVITDPLITRLIDTKEFQRLRNIKQLSTASITFPGAEHTRFSHSIGVYHLAKTIGQHLENHPDWATEKTYLASIAGLLHDIGHGAFSHTFETLFGTDHEAVTCDILTNPETEIHQVLESYQTGFSKDVADVIAHASPHKDVTDLISSQLDADRMDYLLRDAYFTGTSFGNYDKERIIRAFTLENNRIVFHARALFAIEEFIMARYQMYQTVYFHRTNRAAVVLLQNMLKRAKDLYPKAKDFFRITSPRLVPFFEDHYDLNDYLKLDDNILMATFSLWESSGDPILSDLATSYNRRHLPQSVIFDEPEKDLDVLRDIITSYGFDPTYYTEVNKNFDLPYDVSHDDIVNPRTEIHIRYSDGNLKELSDCSPVVKGITAKVYGDKRFFFPREDLGPTFADLTKGGHFHQEKLKAFGNLPAAFANVAMKG